MLRSRCLVPFLLLLVCGCTTYSQSQVRKSAVEMCAEQGKRWYEIRKGSQGGIFGTVSVAGECVGPDDPRYDDAIGADA